MAVFEESPGDFINYILSKESTSAEYGFEEVTHTTLPAAQCKEDGFDCEKYFYHKDSEDSQICRKYGALCGNVLCTHLK